MRLCRSLQTKFVAAGVVGALAIAGCAPSRASYRRNAETFLKSEKFLEQAVGRVTSKLTVATCTEPVDTEVGTTFGCSAADDAGVTYTIGVRISGASEMEFEVARA